MSRTYDAFLVFGEKSDAELAALRKLLEESPFRADVTAKSIDLSYAGRDTNRVGVTSLVRLAVLLGEADGEVRCTIEYEDDRDDEFEFYTIRSGVLWKQDGRIVRSAIAPVDVTN